MKKQNSPDAPPLECSFCRKPQSVVNKLVSNASDFPRRVYICDECIMVCTSILEDSRRFAVDAVSIALQERHPALDNPEISRFLRFVERWIALESAGADSVAAFAEVRAIALGIFAPKK